MLGICLADEDDMKISTQECFQLMNHFLERCVVLFKAVFILQQQDTCKLFTHGAQAESRGGTRVWKSWINKKSKCCILLINLLKGNLLKSNWKKHYSSYYSDVLAHLGFHIQHGFGSDVGSHAWIHFLDMIFNNCGHIWSFIFFIFRVVLSCTKQHNLRLQKQTPQSGYKISHHSLWL